MHGLALFLLWIAAPPESEGWEKQAGGEMVEVAGDEIDSGSFRMPLRIAAADRPKIATIRLFVSEDRGKTWKHLKDCRASDEDVTFDAPRDGVYWFALQVVTTGGESFPPDRRRLLPARKVVINTE